MTTRDRREVLVFSEVLQALEAHIMLPRSRVSRTFGVPPGKGILKVISLFLLGVKDLLRATNPVRVCEFLCHEAREALSQRACESHCRSLMLLCEGLGRRVLRRAWHPMMGPSGLQVEEPMAPSRRRATRSSWRATRRSWRRHSLARPRLPWRGSRRATVRGYRGLHVFETLRV